MAPIKIAIMARSLGLRYGGVYRYVVNVLRELDKPGKDGQCEIYIVHNEVELHGQFPHCHEIYHAIPHTYWHRALFDYVYSVADLRQLQPDYVIYPKNIIPPIHMLLPARKLPIILDLGHFEKGLRAYRFWDTFYARAFIKPSCLHAYKIITISNSTKRDIVERFRIQPQKIQVIHLGIESKFIPYAAHEGVLQKFHVQRPYMFYNGSITPRKNLMRILEAFHAIKDQIPHILYITGSLQWGINSIQTYIRDHLPDRVFTLGYVEEEELIALYNYADLFLYPSLHEGFGLPILEAQACGCPVLTSTVTACPEVAGNSAHLVDPYSVREIEIGMLKILQQHEYAQELIQKGFQNITRFHWKKTAEEIMQVCDKEFFL